ncbi:hypothetical protein Marpi_0300 [Marinitoga piezophila KA3]|uniref:Rad50/SbcC-type AAA domain-containing protein n=1 Tax=Marinitoga piezophila (strain DSM 14283 / JCM 11233 / KA3) TaxID=443254 RepID=H2J423_MARPK|nr:ATP-binding protein [Marinitoga piezophila]AEX84751.1 hypothetical protein Marpi_0300 [Marinitoga piezophila KA3]
MKLILKKLKMKNFKGIRDLEITFDKKETSIFGANATGKTSIFDAFVWLLFDKDSTNRTQFEIKTLDKNGNVIHGLEHSVEAIIEIDGKETSFKKIYKEKWTKRRGESTKQLTGHVTDFFIDDIPVKKSEYQQRINEIIDEKIFKLVTNPLYFNEQLHWTERRKLLLEIVGDVSNDEIIKSKRSLSKIEEFLKDKEIDEFKKMISYKKKKLNDEIKTIPIRIDEINQSLADYNLDFKEIEKNIEILNKQLEEIENKILDESKIYEENSKIKSKIYEKQNELQKIQYEKQLNQEAPKRELEEQLRRIKYEIKNIQSNVQDFENEIERLQEKEKDYKEQIQYNKEKIQELQIENEKLRKKWQEEKSKEFVIDEKQFVCPTCGQMLPENQKEEKIKEMELNFETNKNKILENIRYSGMRNKNEIEKLEQKNQDFEEKIKNINKKINELKIELDNNKDDLETYIAKKIEIEERIENFKPIIIETPEEKILKAKIEKLKNEVKEPDENTIEILKVEKRKILKEIDELKNKLSFKEQQEKAKKRIEELQNKERELANQIAELEGYEYLCDEFIKTKVDMLEEKINSKFKQVKFKLFNVLVNGSIEETCETLIEGVPFQDANNAAKISVGLDIINVLSDHFNVYAPVFIDNRESIVELPETNSQIINLFVSAKDKKLRVENKKLEEVRL